MADLNTEIEQQVYSAARKAMGDEVEFNSQLEEQFYNALEEAGVGGGGGGGPDYYIVEFSSTADNSAWHKLYNNGWLECGGIVSGQTRVTVNFPYEFAERPMFLCTIDTDGSGFSNQITAPGFTYNVTTTTCYPFVDKNFRRCCWQASGYIKKTE